MIKYFKIIIKSIVFFSVIAVFAQKKIYETQLIGVKDGLVNSNTYDILQGDDNFMWISTIGNLLRYDGYDFKNYDASFFNINENSTLLLALDKQNRIWFCEDKSYATQLKSGVLDTRTDSIYDFETITNGLFKSNEVYCLNPSKKTNTTIFVTTNTGIVYKYDGQFKEIFRIPDFRYRRVRCEIGENNTYWITYENNKITNVDSFGNVLQTCNVNKNNFYVNAILATTPYFVFESYNSELIRNYWQIKNIKPLVLNQGNNFQLLHLSDSEILFYENDTIFKSTTKPLIQLKHKTPIAYIPNLKHNGYYKDKQGIIWITSTNGLYKITAKTNPFTVLQANNSIRGIFIKDNKLWVGGYKASVVKDLNTENNYYSKLPIVTATRFIKDKNNNLWAGSTDNILYRLKNKDSVLSVYKVNPYKELQVPHINPITNTFWIGTDSGLLYLDKSNTVKTYNKYTDIEDAHIRQFLNTSEGLWIVTHKGLFLMDAKSEIITKHYSKATGLPTDNINHIYKDSDGVFWLATKTKGLIKWSIKDNTVKTFSTQDGLSNNTIYAVYEDDYNYLWLPSNYGLMRFNKSTYDIQTFTKNDGVADNEFNTFAHFKAKDGTLYFGGINGITFFNPKDFISNTNTEHPIYLTGLKLLKKNTDEFEDLPINTIANKPVSIDYNDQILQLKFSLLDFESVNKHQYAYKIEGYHNQWIYTRDNTISIFNFPYGKQTIRIKAKADSDMWSSNELAIPLFINKPFYLKWEFILLSFIMAIMLFYYYFKWRLRKLNKAKLKLEAQVKSRTKQIENDKRIIELQAEELKTLDKAKGRFFANLTHELRTPLTLIIGPLEQIIDTPPPAAILKRRANGILNNTKHILGLINQLLDLSKLENKQMPIELVNADIVAYTKELVDRFQALATQQHQVLSFESNHIKWLTNFDRDKWDKIVYNLISNALKFTPKNGNIHVVLNQCVVNKEDAIELLVADSGIGIEEKNLATVFDRFYQVDLSSTRANDGTGVGLALVKELVDLQNGNISITSAIGKGSTFKIVLPVLPDTLIKPYVPNHQNTFLIPPEKNNEDTATTQIEQVEKLDVLVVEDNEDIRDYILQCLGQQHYNITVAKNGEEGLEKAMSLIPDIIISDVMMPKKNGFDLVEDVRKHTSTSHIPIILLTAKSEIDSKLKGLNRGADDYLTKPFNPRELNIRVKNLIQIRQNLQKRYTKNGIQTEDSKFEKEDIFISQLKAFILNHINETDLNGDVIGKHFGLSRIHLYRKLKALTNVSISEFVKDIRLEKGLMLLSKKQLNISEIAYEIGFTSPSHFSRSFKEKYGKSPSQM
jgi:signal transduction histidine kinase/DNA-binding response OmpR family regulator/ligand-binding sensor domain-containing protein